MKTKERGLSRSIVASCVLASSVHFEMINRDKVFVAESVVTSRPVTWTTSFAGNANGNELHRIRDDVAIRIFVLNLDGCRCLQFKLTEVRLTTGF